MVDVLFIVLPDTPLMDLASAAEALRRANTASLQQGEPGAFAIRHVGPQASALTAEGLYCSGLAPLPETLARPTWIVLGSHAGPAPTRPADAAWAATRDWLTRVVGPALREADGAHRLLTIGEGIDLAAAAGLVDGRRCTTHPSAVDALQQAVPTAQPVPNRLWVEDGPLASCAGSCASLDLMLHLIGGVNGDALAARIAHQLVMAARRSADAPQRSPLLQYRDHLHGALQRVQDAVSLAPTRDWPVEALAEVADVTTRHLTRLFRQHTGLSPRAWVEHVRVTLARQALARGASAQQAALLAGFASDRQWRRARQRAERAERAQIMAEEAAQRETADLDQDD
ncbi:MAG: hypothetical protein RIQ53_1161 [Pseudomonadota bacterium]|jgi:transcriptional regulator GlxA family with amidase domain